MSKLVDALTENFVDPLDYFAGSALMPPKGEFIQRITVPIKSLTATQDYIGLDKAKGLAKEYDPKRAVIEVVEDGDELKIYDGHHTAVAAALAGHENVPVTVFAKAQNS